MYFNWISLFDIKIEYIESLALDLEKEAYFSTCCIPEVLKFEHTSESPAGLVTICVVGPHPRVACLGWGLRICF